MSAIEPSPAEADCSQWRRENGGMAVSLERVGSTTPSIHLKYRLSKFPKPSSWELADQTNAVPAIYVSIPIEWRAASSRSTPRSQFNPQFFDFAVQAGEAELQPFGSFAFVGPLAEDSRNVQSFVVPQRGAEVVGIRQRLCDAEQFRR